ncbi:SCO family protein [Candidimonas nitroreducens]|uniref:SCO family protein n=1 Tax=Candidimonas nitroreducens TaxID=683354 RepID=A0A225MAN1_9BURK|nr:SCO family protein [Candidimonas nitroreducens]OWT58354.1 SCO family protein [Candidimonas nitroreducens]
MRLAVSLLLVCLLGLGAIYAQTDGFTVVTAESARRLSVEHHPRPIPDAGLVLESGASAPLLQWLQSDGRIAIVDFIYTRCISICAALGSEFQQLQAALRSRGLGDRVRLLSISFDPADSADDLARYARGLHADPQLWQFAGAADARQRRALLDTFGIVVVPAPLGQFVHNAALHVVTADGRLARVVDYDDPDQALQAAVALAGRAGPACPTGGRAAWLSGAGRAAAAHSGEPAAAAAGAPRSQEGGQ